MIHRRPVVMSLVACGSVLVMGIAEPARAGQAATLEQILQRAASHVARFAVAMSSVVAQEDYLQVVLGPAGSADTRRTRADTIVLDAGGVGSWVPYRDVFEVDGKPVRDREERLSRLLAGFTPDSLEQALAITAESARFNLNAGNIVIDRSVNTPITTLMFLKAENQSRSSFRLGGTDTIDGVRYRVISFVEQQRPPLVRSTPDASTRGTFWIEPRTGRVVRSEMQMDASITPDWVRFIRARITVAYAQDPTLGIWVPVTMDESYDLNGISRIVSGRADYSNFRQFGVSTHEQVR